MPDLTDRERHDLLVHLQWKHQAMPPYQGEPEDVHGDLHDDAAEPFDAGHDIDRIVLPPQGMYPTPGPRTYYSERLGRRVTIPED